METYKYQLHTHTAPCSACAQLSPRMLCRDLFEHGYQGAVLTNHFYHGNTGIERGNAKTWETFVDAYANDYRLCLEEARKYDLDILFGIEEVVAPGLEILCYGITPKVLYDNPQLRYCSIIDWVQIMRRNGVVLIQAHPYREVFYIPKPGVLPLEYIDGIEIYNRGNATRDMDKKAVDFSDKHPNLIKTSGGDAHRLGDISHGGIVVGDRIYSEQELANCLRRGQYTLIVE